MLSSPALSLAPSVAAGEPREVLGATGGLRSGEAVEMAA